MSIAIDVLVSKPKSQDELASWGEGSDKLAAAMKEYCRARDSLQMLYPHMCKLTATAHRSTSTALLHGTGHGSV